LKSRFVPHEEQNPDLETLAHGFARQYFFPNAALFKTFRAVEKSLTNPNFAI
jgi:hypothetical protein